MPRLSVGVSCCADLADVLAPHVAPHPVPLEIAPVAGHCLAQLARRVAQVGPEGRADVALGLDVRSAELDAIRVAAV